MTTPLAVAAASEPLAAAYRATWADVVAFEASLVAAPRPWRRAGSRSAFLAQLHDALDGLDAGTLAWFAATYPELYAAGAIDTAGILGLEWSWTLRQRARATALADTAAAALRRATRGTLRTARALMGTLGRHPELLGGPSADLTRLVQVSRIHAVRYTDRSRQGLGTYAPMVLDTATTTAYNAGTLGMGEVAGVSTYLVSDGAGCGWTDHDDPDTAAGSLRSAQDLEDFPLAHPHCRRSFAPWLWAGVPARDVLGVPA